MNTEQPDSQIMDREELMGTVADGWAKYQQANADRITAALDTGAALIALREVLGHGEFLPMLKQIGIGETTARNWMRLARAGFKTATVADLGGIRAALEHLREHAKTAGEVRVMEMETENVRLRRLVGDALVVAAPETLGRFARLVAMQRRLGAERAKVNRLVTENEINRREIAAYPPAVVQQYRADQAAIDR